MRTTTLLLTILGGCVVFSATSAFAQNNGWAEKMFDKLDHDFGVVARGTDARYRLKITNKYRDPVHIANVSTTCGCTAAKPAKDTITSNESTYVEITMNTIKFEGHKPSSVTIVFDRPAHGEVRIPIHAFIRRDVVLTPGGAQFGTITKGTGAERTIDIAYAGRGNWTIKDIINKNPNLVARLVQTRRDAANVNYQLRLSMKDGAPVGEFRDQLTLVTDDPGNPYIPLLAEGRVETEYAVNPDVVSLGTLAPGERKTVNVVIRGKKAFSVEKIESNESSELFEVRLPKEARQTHVVPLTVIAPDAPGPLDEEFSVTISDHSQHLTFKAHGKVVSTTSASTNAGAATVQTSQ